MGETIRVLVLNGPNLNLLGKREPALYGRQTLEGVLFRLGQQAKELGMELHSYQSNFEGELINKLHEAPEHYTFVIFNPGAFTHTSIALRDAIASISIPVIEVHITNIFARESWRNKSTISSVCAGTISGMGTIGYRLALEAGYSHIKAVLRSHRANTENASSPKQTTDAAPGTSVPPHEASLCEASPAAEPGVERIAEPRQAEHKDAPASSADAQASVAPQPQNEPRAASGEKRVLSLSIAEPRSRKASPANAEDETAAAVAPAVADSDGTKPAVARPAEEQAAMARPVVLRVKEAGQALVEPAQSSRAADISAEAYYAENRLKVKPSSVLADDFASGEARFSAMRKALNDRADRYDEANNLNDAEQSEGADNAVNSEKKRSSPFIGEAEQGEPADIKDSKKSSLKNRIGQMLNKGKRNKK